MKNLIATLLALLLIGGTLPSPAEPDVPEDESTVSTEEDDYEDDIPMGGAEMDDTTESITVNLKEVEPFIDMSAINLTSEMDRDIFGDCPFITDYKEYRTFPSLSYSLKDVKFKGDSNKTAALSKKTSATIEEDSGVTHFYFAELDSNVTEWLDKLFVITYDGTYRFWESDIEDISGDLIERMKSPGIEKAHIYYDVVIPVSSKATDGIGFFIYIIDTNKRSKPEGTPTLYRYDYLAQDITIYSYGLGIENETLMFNDDFSPIFNSDKFKAYADELQDIKAQLKSKGINAVTDAEYSAILSEWSYENKKYISEYILHDDAEKRKYEDISGASDISIGSYTPTVMRTELLIEKSRPYLDRIKEYLNSK